MSTLQSNVQTTATPSDDGRTLEVKMHMQGPGGTSRDFVRVYRRESA